MLCDKVASRQWSTGMLGQNAQRAVREGNQRCCEGQSLETAQRDELRADAVHGPRLVLSANAAALDACTPRTSSARNKLLALDDALRDDGDPVPAGLNRRASVHTEHLLYHSSSFLCRQHVRDRGVC